MSKGVSKRAIPAQATFLCPNCKSEVLVGAAFCRECGSDAQTGWSDETYLDDLDLPLAGKSAWEAEADFQEGLKHKGHMGKVLLGLAALALLGLRACR